MPEPSTGSSTSDPSTADRSTAADPDRRVVRMRRLDTGVYEATNSRGGTLRFGSKAGADFTPVELLLAALGGCSAVDIDVVTGRRALPSQFDVMVAATVVKDDGNRLSDVEVRFELAFPPGAGGDAAATVAPKAARVSHERTCTVSRSLELPTPVTMLLDIVDRGDGD
jgi:uncharacterized OsmC-like protein